MGSNWIEIPCNDHQTHNHTSQQPLYRGRPLYRRSFMGTPPACGRTRSHNCSSAFTVCSIAWRISKALQLSQLQVRAAPYFARRQAIFQHDAALLTYCFRGDHEQQGVVGEMKGWSDAVAAYRRRAAPPLLLRCRCSGWPLATLVWVLCIGNSSSRASL